MDIPEEEIYDLSLIKEKFESEEDFNACQIKVMELCKMFIKNNLETHDAFESMNEIFVSMFDMLLHASKQDFDNCVWVEKGNVGMTNPFIFLWSRCSDLKEQGCESE